MTKLKSLKKKQERLSETLKWDFGYKLDFQSGNPGLPLITLFGKGLKIASIFAQTSTKQHAFKMDCVINLAMPYIGEQIFQSIHTDTLILCVMPVSKTWKVLVTNVLLKRLRKLNGEILEVWRTRIPALMKLFLDNFEIQNTEHNREYAKKVFIWCCNYGLRYVVKSFLENSGNSFIDFSYQDGFEEIALIGACKSGRKGVVQVLLDYSINSKSIDLNVRDDMNKTAFMWACENGQTDIVKLFLNHSGKNIDFNAKIRENYEMTAFMLACIHGKLNVVRVILEHSDRQKVDINAKDDIGMTALMHIFELEYRRRKDIIQLLLDHLAFDIHAKDNFGLNAFMHACVNGKKGTVQLFLDHPRCTSDDYNARDKDGMTGYNLAVKYGQIGVVKLIRQYSNSHGIKLYGRWLANIYKCFQFR